jgi:aminoglycoside phosphotransferase (APT) family kinase protein
LIKDVRTRLGEEDWLMLIFEEVDGRPPRRPWTIDDVMAAVAAVETTAQALTPAPSGFDWQPLSVELGGLSPDKEEAIDRDFPTHAGELRELVAAFGDLCAGDTLVHADLRDDNMIIDRSGRAWICDWNFPLLGRPFVDLVTLLISVRGDGLDADRLLRNSSLVTPHDASAIDSFLADLMLYYRIASRRPGPDSSPHLRDHQRWNGRVIAGWLAERRGWRSAP